MILAQLFFMGGDLLLQGCCVDLHINLILHQSSEPGIPDQFDDDFRDCLVNDFFSDLFFVFTFMATIHSAMLTGIVVILFVIYPDFATIKMRNPKPGNDLGLQNPK
jgi:hypothetical protein